MTSRLDGRVAIVTGGGRGLGRAHALELAHEGAYVVVNDVGVALDGSGADSGPAQLVVDEIRAFGGQAVASTHDVSDWAQAAALVQLAVESFGDLHVLVNNAGILRDRTLASISESEWDDVIRVHLKGHAAPTAQAMAHWRAASKAGNNADRCVITTSSAAGLAGNFGQAAYSSAKAAVIALAAVVRLEGARYGVRANVVSPGARTRLSLSTPGAEDELAALNGAFDEFDPANVSPVIAWLADARCPANGQVLHVIGSRVVVTSMPEPRHELVTQGRWSLEQLDEQLTPRLIDPAPMDVWFTSSEPAPAR